VEIVPQAGSGLASQSRVVEVSATGAPPLPLDAVAIVDQGGPARATLRITDPDGVPISGVRVAIDGLPVGTTADGGYLQVAGLTAGDHAVVVQHESFTGQSMTFVLDSAGVARSVVLQRQPGTVRVVVKDAAGAPVTDAVVRFVGNARLAPMPIGGSGERTQVLSAGQWLAIVSSPTFGIQQRELAVTEDRIDLIEVLVVFQPMEQGSAELELRVVGPTGEPVEGATVAIDGASVGATSTGGTLRIGPLAGGARVLEVGGPDLEPLRHSIVLADGLQERVEQIRYRRGAVEVSVRGPDGPVAVKVSFDRNGAAGKASPPVRAEVGSTGRLRQVLPEEGSWTVTAISAEYGVQQREFEVSLDGSLQRVDIVLQPFVGGSVLSLLVTDPDGRSVDGAAVWVDGFPLGRTADGTAWFDGVAKGPHQVEIRPPDGYASKRVGVEVKDLPPAPGKADVHTIVLDWAEYALKFRVTSAGAPAADALVRLFSGEQATRPMPVDTRGERVTTASRGLWAAVVTSSAGVWQGEFEVKTTKLTTVDVEIKPVDAAFADLMVRVVDPDGQPVDDPRVLLGDAKLGEGEVGGTVLGRKLPPGSYLLLVSAPDFQPSAPRSVSLEAGQALGLTVPLEWITSRVSVNTVDARGEPIDAIVSFRGPSDVPSGATGADGAVDHSLRPGRYEVFAASGDLAAAGALEVVLGSDPQPLVLELTPATAVMAGESVRIQEMVQFDFGLATLRPDGAPILAEVARVLKSQPNIVRIEIQGHTDSVGSPAMNATLSQARAESVLAALVALGVPRETLYATGYGSTRPIGDNTSDEGRAANRRVQFEVVERGL
ncbi:MAG: OmpA family protein, partial [Myxococcota bacterium]